jgi:delta24-sterol reductase
MSSNPALESHDRDVQNVASAVKRSFVEKRPFRIFHGHTNSTRQNVLKKNESIDVSMLNRVLQFDLENKRVLVEPNVAMDSLVQATLKHGLIPAVVPEFPGITVGGAYAGTAGESSSFRFGFFDRLVTKAEVVLADGKTVEASEKGEKELFDRLPSTMGTLGVVTAVEVQLVKAKRFVETQYIEVKSMEEATEMIKANLGNTELDFLDAIMFSPTSGAVVMGKLTNTLPESRKPQRFSGPWDPWYYMHVQSRISTPTGETPATDYIPIAEYLFRYDRGGFWVGRSAFKYMHFPFNRLTRWFLDDFLHTRMLYRALHASKNVIGYVVQDLALPYEAAPKFIEFTDKEFQIYPLWLCPLKESPEEVGKESFHPWLAADTSSSEPSSTTIKTTMKPMLNIGLWGLPPPTAKKHKDYIQLNQRLEDTLHNLRGLKWLYSRTYYTAEQFWTYYPKGWYDALRKRYRAEHLPDVWQKVHVDVVKETKEMEGWKARVLGVWPVAGLYGVWKGMWSGEWRVARKVRIGDMDVPDQDSLKKGKGA